MIKVDKNYDHVLKQMEQTIKDSRYKAMQAANTEVLTTYWEIGRTILELKEKAGEGEKIITKLANDLKAQFPNMKGLTELNLTFMQTFASAWPFFPFTQPAAAQQPANQQPLPCQISWPHHMIILDKTNTLDERIFYIKEAIKNGWSRDMLKVNIETGLFKRQGKKE